MDPSAKLPWYHRPWTVLGLLFLLGPFAFPFLFRSPAFSKPVKVILTVLTLGLTVWAVMISVETVRAVLARLKEMGLVLA